MIEIADQCVNRWRSILPMFGIGPEFLTGKHRPCPICEGTDRFRFDDKEGRGTFFCTNCRPGDGVKLVMLKTRLSFADAAAQIRERLGETTTTRPQREADPTGQRRAATSLWGGASPIFDDEAGRYLAGRGLCGPYPASLRFHPSARVTDHPMKSTLPAMLALVSDPDGNPVTVHRTFLEGGRKACIPAPRKMMAGSVPEGSAIRLGSHSGTLGVAEGVETALAVRRRFGIPCWAAIDDGKLAKFAVPADVRELIIFGDNDLNHVGQAAAEALAKRVCLSPERPEIVRVRIPLIDGTDWADEQPDDQQLATAA